MSKLTLSFLGSFEAQLGDRSLINFRSAKIQGLLIYLVLTQQQAHNRNVLAALFWPDEPEDRAKHNLRHSLYRLRQLLGDDGSEKQPFLLITRATVQFNSASHYSLDVADFLSAVKDRAWETAVSHYHGDLLPGFSCDSLPFDDWLRAKREQLHRMALDALFECTALSLTRGDYANGQRLARQQLTLEPWREEAHQQLMQTLALLGDRSGALAQYETCRRVLADELGVEPTAATQTLFARIRDQQLVPEIRHQANAPRQLTVPFIGRHQEYEALVKAYQQTANNTLQIISLVGNAGMGKTRLAQQFLAWAGTQGADVLYGRSHETSAGLSYQPLTHLLRQRIERENAPEDLLSDLWLSQLTRLLPELSERYPDLPPPTQEENSARQHLFEAITRLGQALAALRPVVLFIDDWHWADDASRDVLQYAAQRWAEQQAPILILLTLRQEALAASPELQSWFNQLKRTAAAEQLYVDKLSKTETEQLLHLLLTSEAKDADREAASSTLTQFSNWLFQETGGQPLFLTEALKVLAEDNVIYSASGSDRWRLDWSQFDARGAQSRMLTGIRETIQRWLTRLSVRAGEILAATAVLAQEASFDKLCWVSGLEEMQAVNALDELLNRRLLLEMTEGQTLTPGPIYTFSHQKVSEVVYGEMGTARRRLLHRRAFETLQASQAAAADCAHHALQAGLTAETIRYSLVAGNEAMNLFAVSVAIPHYETAWRIAEQQGWPQTISNADRQLLYSGLGRAYELNEEWTRAEETYRAMISAAQSIKSPAMECLALNQLATIYYLKFSKEEQAVTLLNRSLALAKQHGDRRGMVEAELHLAMAAFQNSNHALTLHHAEQALDTARELGHPQLMAQHLSILSYVALQQRKWDKLEAYAAEASQLYTSAGNLVLAADCERNVGLGQLLIGKPQEALVTFEKTAIFSRHIENLWGEAECTWKLAYTHLELGHYGLAIKLGEEGIMMNRQLDIPTAVSLSLIVGSIVQRKCLSLAAAKETLLEIVTVYKERIFEIIWDWALAELCTTYALAGEWQQAVEYAKQRLDTRQNDSYLSMSLSGWYEIEALLRSSDGDVARAEVVRMAGLVGNNKRYRLTLHRSQAVLAQWDGDVVQAVMHLENALTLAREMALPGEEWPILGELGRLYAAQGEDEKARAAYREAGMIIRRLAETIDDERLREGFVMAVSTRTLLNQTIFKTPS